jgi:ribonuclease HI
MDINIDNLINESYNNLNIKDNEVKNNLENEIIINKYELLLFTDGAHERVKKRSSFGIYIQSLNEKNELYKYNDTKIIKKINKDHIIYNKNNIINYHSLFYITNDKCKSEDCNYYAIYASKNNNNNLLNGEFCKIHKTDDMIQSAQFINYDPTNIRAEGLAIIYSLIYLKIILIDNITNKDDIISAINTIEFNNELKFTEYNPVESANNKYFLIITDSEFWINVITKWCNNWIKKDIVLEKKNIDLIYYINYLLTLLAEKNIIIEFKFVRGHSDKDAKQKKQKLNLFQKGNVIADKLANLAKENINYNVKISF